MLAQQTIAMEVISRNLFLVWSFGLLWLCSGYKLLDMVVFDSEIYELTWLGASDQIVYVVTEEGHLWRSGDGGSTFHDKTSDLEDSMVQAPSVGEYVPKKGIRGIFPSPLDENKAFFAGYHETHWITMDNGMTFSKVKGPKGMFGVQVTRFHPTEEDWILAIVRRWSCLMPEESDAQLCADDLFLTKDFGRTWTSLTESANGRILGFVDFDWGWSKEAGKSQGTSKYHKETVLATVYENRPEVLKHLKNHRLSWAEGWDPYIDFVKSDDFFASAHLKTVSCGNQFEILDGKLFLAAAEPCHSDDSKSLDTGVALHVSSDYGNSFLPACFSVPLTERGYSILFAAGGSVFVNVDYLGGALPLGTLYSADGNGTMFSLSLRGNVRSRMSSVDFAPVQGVPGVFIANAVDAIAGDEELSVDESKTTRITYSGGSRWDVLAPPEVDSDQRAIRCSLADKCSLHLHGAVTWEGMSHIPGFPFVYSHPTAPGIVMATGNVGRYLYQDNTVNTYLSRDAGATWQEVAKGPHIYEFGDQGGVIVMAQHYLQGPAKELMFSLDEGLTWKHADLSRPMEVYNIRVEPDNQGRKFLIQGTLPTESGEARQGTVVAIDFTEGDGYTLCQASDYEKWSPDGCVRGAKLTLERQVRTSECWNGPKYVRPPLEQTPCNCSDVDLECDFGASRTHDGKCVAIADFDAASCRHVRDGSYVLSSTLERVVAGDVCLNPTEPVGEWKVVPGRKRGVSFGAVFGWLFGLVAVGAVALGVLIYRGHLPDDWVAHIPFAERLRYRTMRTNFQSLSDDFGLSGGDEDDYLELRR